MFSPKFKKNVAAAKPAQNENNGDAPRSAKSRSQKRKHSGDNTKDEEKEQEQGDEQTQKRPRSEQEQKQATPERKAPEAVVDEKMLKVVQTKYRIFEQIGEGAFGKVFRAEKRRSSNGGIDHKQYAIKFIHPRHRPDEESTKTGSFSETNMMGLSVDTMSELSLLSRLKHPNIIRMEEAVYDAADHTLEVVMELADCDLLKLIKTWWAPLVTRQKRKENVPLMLRIAYEVFCGLNYLHQNGIMHLDVKPTNVLIVGGVAKLADFGLSEREEGTRADGQGKVTWPYRSPELQCNLARYSPAADTWAVGMMLAEMFFRSTIMMHKAPSYDDNAEDPSLFRAILQTVGTPPAKLMKAYEAAGRRCSATDDAPSLAAASVSSSSSASASASASSSSSSVASSSSSVASSSSTTAAASPVALSSDSTPAQYLDLEKTMLNERDIAYYKDFYTLKRYQAILDLIHACLRFEPTERISFRKVQEHPLFAGGVCAGCVCETVRGFHLPDNAHHPLPRSVELLVRDSGETPSLVRYAREIFKRVEQKNPGMQHDADKRREFACACVSIAAKILHVDKVAPLHAELSLHAAGIKASSMEQLAPGTRSRKWAEMSELLHRLEGECGNLLSWDFDGPWHTTGSSSSSSSASAVVSEQHQENGDFARMRKVEDALPINSGYMVHQQEITTVLREKIIDWMVQVQAYLNLEEKTLFRAVQTFDRFLASESVALADLQLVAWATMLSVSRRESLEGPTLEQIVRLAGKTLTRGQLTDMEARVDAHMLGVQEPPLAIDFFNPLARICEVNQDTETWFLAMYYTELALLKYMMLGFEGSRIAASAFCLATNTVRGGGGEGEEGDRLVWTLYQQEQTGYTLDQLAMCIKIMYAVIKANQDGTTKSTAIKKKFAAYRFNSVSGLICASPEIK